MDIDSTNFQLEYTIQLWDILLHTTGSQVHCTSELHNMCEFRNFTDNDVRKIYKHISATTNQFSSISNNIQMHSWKRSFFLSKSIKTNFKFNLQDKSFTWKIWYSFLSVLLNGKKIFFVNIVVNNARCFFNNTTNSIVKKSLIYWSTRT